MRNRFTPPRSKPPLLSSPPSIEPREELGDAPHFLPGARPGVRGAGIDALLREAEAHYQTGRKLYNGGDEDGARREFDLALETLLTAPESSATRQLLEKKIEELSDQIYRLDLAGLGAADNSAEPGFEKPPLEDLPELTFPVDPKLKNKVAEELRATVSQLPLEMSDEVLNYINYFSTTRGRKILVYGLRRAGRYRPLIQRILDEEGVPQELIFLAQAESGFFPRAVSRTRNVGMWQFGLASGREHGLMQTPYSDDRMDPEKSTRAAAHYLRDLYHRYGDWYLAMASYNCGPGVIDKAVERTGYADFWELRRRHTIPGETAGYVAPILAMTIMTKNAKEYGLDNIEAEPPLEYDTVTLDTPVHLPLIADIADCPVFQLHELNPALLGNIAPTGALRVPKGTATAMAEVLDSIPAPKRLSWRAHRAVEGDSVTAVAHRYRVSEDALVAANNLNGKTFDSGDVLVIPVAAPAARPPARHSTGASRRRAGTHRAAAATAARSQAHRTPAAASRAKSKPVTYTASNTRPHHSKHSTVKR